MAEATSHKTELTPQQHRAGRDFAERVAAIASEAPNSFCKRAVFRAVNAMREFHGFSDEEKCRQVRKSLGFGASTYADLERETRLPMSEVQRVVRMLKDTEPPVVEIRQLASGDRGGRPTVYITLLGAETGRISPAG